MPAREKFLVGDQAGAELFRGIVLVMKMHFNFTEPLPAKLRQSVKVFGVVLFERVEERVTRRPTVAVSELSEQAGIVVRPTVEPFSGL